MPLPFFQGNKEKIELQTVPEGYNDNCIADDPQLMQGLGRYILATRKNGNWNTDFEPKLLQSLLDEHDVTVEEAVKAFKKAYSDHYTPSSGIEWRHLWKHIEEMRKGRERRLFSYREMMDICDKERINTDHFERLPEVAKRIQNEFPERDPKDIQCWKRK
jgi:hypothetical protein